VVLVDEGLAPAPVEEARLFVGQGARRLLERGAARVGASFSESRLDLLTARFIEAYRADIAGASQPFAHVEEALATLGQRGARLTVCTNKRTDLSESLLQALAMRDRFAAVVGADAVARCKPHPGHLQAAVAQAGGDPARAIMVGDSRTDYDTARAAGAPIVMVSFGYSPEPRAQMPQASWIDCFRELGSTISQLARS
jgi:phosphoglycolate phosphatase